jgi:hypothetical protein
MLLGAQCIMRSSHSMAVKRRFTIDLLLERMSKRFENFILWCGIIGYAGRGIAFFSVGLLFVYVGWNVDNFRFGYVLETFQAEPFTFWVLVTAAAGLTAFGLYLLLAARYLLIASGEHFGNERLFQIWKTN